jgi:hypothetical protein
MVEDKSRGVPVSRPGSFADTNEPPKARSGGDGLLADGLVARAGCLSAIVTAGVGALSMSHVGDVGAVSGLLLLLLAALPVAIAVLLGRGQRNGAKILLGVWLGLLIPSVLVLWFLAMMVSIVAG